MYLVLDPELSADIRVRGRCTNSGSHELALKFSELSRMETSDTGELVQQEDPRNPEVGLISDRNAVM